MLLLPAPELLPPTFGAPLVGAAALLLGPGPAAAPAG